MDKPPEEKFDRAMALLRRQRYSDVAEYIETEMENNES